MTYWTLSTELKGDFLQVGLSGGLQNVSSSNGRASECHLVNAHVACNGSSGVASVTIDQVDRTRGESSLFNQLAHVQGIKRSCFGSLDNDCISTSKRWSDLPGEHEEWEAVRYCQSWPRCGLAILTSTE